MECWPGDLVLEYGATATPINMQGEVPVLESWLLASSDTAAKALADRLAETQDIHSRSTKSDTPLAINPIEARAIHDALGANRQNLDAYPGLTSLWNTMSTAEV
jgi:hypothetical protein